MTYSYKWVLYIVLYGQISWIIIGFKGLVEAFNFQTFCLKISYFYFIKITYMKHNDSKYNNVHMEIFWQVFCGSRLDKLLLGYVCVQHNTLC